MKYQIDPDLGMLKESPSLLYDTNLDQEIYICSTVEENLPLDITGSQEPICTSTTTPTFSNELLIHAELIKNKKIIFYEI